MPRPPLPENHEKTHLTWASDTELEIHWPDGHRSRLALAYLRNNCPCALCKEQRKVGIALAKSASLAQELRALAVSPVGRYAVRFHWSDGHHTGLYAYGYLRRLCPCAECRAAEARGNMGVE